MNELVDDGSFDWIQDHWLELSAKFSGQWIAVVNQQVVAHAPHLVTLRGIAPVNAFFDYIYPADDEIQDDKSF